MAMPAAPAPQTTRTSWMSLAHHLQGVGQGRQHHHGGAVLVVVEDGDVTALFQLALDLKAAGAAMSSRFTPPKLPWSRATVLTMSSTSLLATQGHRVHAAEGLEQHALALHHRHPGLRADVPRPRTAVPSVTTATVFQR